MVNYDKWDKLEVSDDESDGYGKSDRRVGVTKLDGPSKVTFGGGASDVVTIDALSFSTASLTNAIAFSRIARPPPRSPIS